MSIPDNYDLWERHDRVCEERLMRCPQCDGCHKHIQEEFYFYIEGDILCEDCMEDRYMHRTEDYYE